MIASHSPHTLSHPPSELARSGPKWNFFHRIQKGESTTLHLPLGQPWTGEGGLPTEGGDARWRGQLSVLRR